MSFRYSINGFELSDKTLRRGIWLLDGTEYAPALAPRRLDVKVPGRHYQIPAYKDPMSEITVAMHVRMRGDTAADLAELWDIFTGLLWSGSDDGLTLKRWREGVTEESAVGQLLSRPAPDFHSNANILDTTVVFNIPGGCWRGPVMQDDFTGQGTWSSNLAKASTMPINDVQILVTGPCTSFMLRDGITRTGVRWGGMGQTVPAGQYLLISTDVMRAGITSTPAWGSLLTNASSSLIMVDEGPLVVASRWSGDSFGSVTKNSQIVIERSADGPVSIQGAWARA